MVLFMYGGQGDGQDGRRQRMGGDGYSYGLCFSHAPRTPPFAPRLRPGPTRQSP